MNTSTQKIILTIKILTDISIVISSWLIAYFIRFYFFSAPKGIPNLYLYIKLIPFILTIWLITLLINGFYARSSKKRSAILEGLDIIYSCTIAILFFVFFTYFYSEYKYSRITLTVFYFLHIILLITGRSILRKILRKYMHSNPPKNILIIASGPLITKALVLIKNDFIYKQNIIGIILIGNKYEISEGTQICEELNLTIINKPKQWLQFLDHNNINQVIICVSATAYQQIEDDIDQITELITDCKIIPDIFKYTKLGPAIYSLNQIPFIEINSSPLSGNAIISKRIFDIIGSIFALIIFAPLMIVIAILVKLSSKGPIFYKQERMGLDGKIFQCLKFRSMPQDAEKQTGAIWATADDPRPTKIGKILRKYSLDELPQFINVLKGDMSIVGPRPERPIFVQEFKKKIPKYMLRHKVKTGITGLAQVRGWRGNTSIERRIECDIEYIQTWSIWLDIKIILLTIIEIFNSKNAY